MLQIYELATNTIAWLGDPQERLEAVIMATTWDMPNTCKQGEGQDLNFVTTGAEWVYSAQYFRRLWI